MNASPLKSNQQLTLLLIQLSLPLFGLFSLIAMAPMNLAFGLVVLSFLMVFVFHLNFSISQASASYSYFAGTLVLACLISVVASTYWPYSYAGHPPTQDAHTLIKLLHFIFPLIYASVFSVAAQHPLPAKFKSQDLLMLILRIWMGVLIVLAPFGVLQFFTGIVHSQVIPTSPNFFHVTLFFGHHLSTASIILFPTFAALAIALGEYLRSRKVLYFECTAACSGLLILFLTFARTAWLVIPIGLLLIMTRYLKRSTVVTGLVALAIVLGALSQMSVVKERIQNNMGIQDRFRLWEANLNYFKHRPLTGIGFLKTQEMSEFYFKELDPEKYKDYFWGHAHSNFFEMLGGAGLLGLLSFLAYMIFTVGFAHAVSLKAKDAGHAYLSDLAAGIGIALILMHINGLTNVNFWEGKVFHQQMWAIGLLLMIKIKLTRKN